MPLPHHQSLAGADWTVLPTGDLAAVPSAIPTSTPIPATIPGCIHTDLIDAKLIPDPAIGDAEDHVQWVSLTDWRYERTFNADPALFAHDEIDLVFDCLDTVARIELNGDHIGDVASEFLPHRFPVLGLLRPGANTLIITFTSPIRHARAESARLGPRPVNGDWEPYNTIRKCASNFQWDWGPRVATCGITADARIEAWSQVRVVHVVPEEWCGDARTQRWRGMLNCELAWSDSARGDFLLFESSIIQDGVVFATGCEVIPVGSTLARVPTIASERPRLWWPSGMGKPDLHTIAIRVLTERTGESGYEDESRRPIATWSGRGAFKYVASIDAEDWAADVPVYVNWESPTCRGANWIPEGLFPRDRTPERTRLRLQQLLDANMNTIRIWGGGRYEPDWFYDLCDELGIMVWHDFMFACACYPEEEPIRSLVEAEARHHVARLARHPCLILWCGGNENHWAYESWGFKDKLAPGQTWGRSYWNDLLPRIVQEISPSTPYLPNSPWSGGDAPPNDPARGDHHTWDITLPQDYRKLVPPFVSEFGWQSPSMPETLAAAGIHAASAETIPPELIRRQRGPGGMARWFDAPMGAILGAPPPGDGFSTWLARAHELQARYLAAYIEWLRIHPERCRGILIWQLNDAWPGLSWSLIDSAGREKPAYDAVKRAFAPRLLTAQPRSPDASTTGSWTLFAINETPEPWSGTAEIIRLSRESTPIASATVPFFAPPNKVTPVAPLAPLIGDPKEDDGEHIRVEPITL